MPAASGVTLLIILGADESFYRPTENWLCSEHAVSWQTTRWGRGARSFVHCPACCSLANPLAETACRPALPRPPYVMGGSCGGLPPPSKRWSRPSRAIVRMCCTASGGRRAVTITVNITPKNRSSQSFRPIRRVAASASSSLASTRDICWLESEYVFFTYSLISRSCLAISACSFGVNGVFSAASYRAPVRISGSRLTSSAHLRTVSRTCVQVKAWYGRTNSLFPTTYFPV